LGAFPLARLNRVTSGVIVNVHHLGDQVAAALAPFAQDGIEVLHERDEAFGTAGTLRAIRDRIEGSVLTCNADLLSDLALEDVMASHRDAGALATIAVTSVASGADVTLRDRSVEKLIDRREELEWPGFLFIGAAVFEKEALSLLPDRRPAGLTETLLAPLIARREVAAHVHEGYARDIGTAEKYLETSIDAVNGRGEAPPRGTWPGRIVAGVYVGRGARIEGTLGPGAVVLAGAGVKAGAHVERAIVWPGEEVPGGRAAVNGIWFDGALVPTRGC
jgi:NDP-sugar pyrophosphorylase family protein